MRPCRIACLFPVFSLALLIQIIFAQTKEPLNVRNFGAIGDGKTKDTAAFQNAIDECADKGGGEVVVPPGKYLIGSIVLKGLVELFMRSVRKTRRNLTTQTS